MNPATASAHFSGASMSLTENPNCVPEFKMISSSHHSCSQHVSGAPFQSLHPTSAPSLGRRVPPDISCNSPLPFWDVPSLSWSSQERDMALGEIFSQDPCCGESGTDEDQVVDCSTREPPVNCGTLDKAAVDDVRVCLDDLWYAELDWRAPGNKRAATASPGLRAPKRRRCGNGTMSYSRRWYEKRPALSDLNHRPVKRLRSWIQPHLDRVLEMKAHYRSVVSSGLSNGRATAVRIAL